MSTNVVRLAALCAAIALPPSVAAQTRFAWPDTIVDVSKYTTVEACLAAAQRVQSGQYAIHSRIAWRDTMPSDIQESLKPLAAPVIRTAVQCAARFDQRTAKLADFAHLMQLYLYAERDADAKSLLERRLAAISAKGAKERISVEDSAIVIYLDAQPRRLDPAEQLLIARARNGGDRLDRFALYSRLLDASVNAGDTTRARRAALMVVAVADSLTPAERESEKFTKLGMFGGNVVVFGAMQQIVGVKTLVDSLRHSTMAMVGLMRTMWTTYTKERPEAFPLPIGEHAPPVTGDLWFPSTAAGEKHPAPRHVSVVQFLDGSAHNGACLGAGSWGVPTDACTFNWSSLRRLSDRFPGLDVTFVVGTRGDFLYAPPPSPAEEAALYHDWIEPYHIKGAVMSVTTRPFWNLPAPDGRRVDKLTPNSIAYSFGKSWQTEGSGIGGKYLIDQDGIIVDVIFNEQATIEFVGALLQREKSGGDRASR
ncbi:MAG TPA: hypothetical protein VGO46_11765 [Gemmatimonadaceae bacterium]|nr:hypothetical protein [Gemmatimonadaceae bacterium]